MFRKFISSALTIAALTLGASQAHAIKIKELSIRDDTGKHEIHVKFDRSKHNWTSATSKPVTFKLWWYLSARSRRAIKNNVSRADIKVDLWPNSATATKHKTVGLMENRHKVKLAIRYSVGKYSTFKFPGNELRLAAKAVATCKEFYANGGRPDNNHKIFIGNVTSKIWVTHPVPKNTSCVHPSSLRPPNRSSSMCALTACWKILKQSI